MNHAAAIARPTALLAEDEPLLALALQAELHKAWPALQIAATVGDGMAAVQQALALQPDVLFFDIRMPGMGGLEAAAELADQWDVAGRAFPALVFVTAYDQYAVQAFEAQAVDYVLKPVRPDRLAQTVARLQKIVAQPAQADLQLGTALAQLRTLMAAPAEVASATQAGAPAMLTVIQASVGNTIRMVPLDDVLYFEAADKYVRVQTTEHEYLIRTPLKDLLPQLDGKRFWQVHRSTVVRVSAIDSLHRDEGGRLHLTLQHRSERLAVSRLYADRFKAM